MSTLQPPPRRVWWKQPLDRTEIFWITIAFLGCCLIMCLLLFYWQVYGKPVLANEAYQRLPERFTPQAQENVNKYSVRTETDQKIAVVYPPVSSAIYATAWLEQWWPALQLEAGKTYFLHILSTDWLYRLQPILDNPFLMLFLGIAMPIVLYLVWGVMESIGIPLGK